MIPVSKDDVKCLTVPQFPFGCPCQKHSLSAHGFIFDSGIQMQVNELGAFLRSELKSCHALPASWGRLQSDVKAKHPLLSASRVRFGDPIPFGKTFQ